MKSVSVQRNTTTIRKGVRIGTEAVHQKMDQTVNAARRQGRYANRPYKNNLT